LVVWSALYPSVLWKLSKKDSSEGTMKRRSTPGIAVTLDRGKLEVNATLTKRRYKY